MDGLPRDGRRRVEDLDGLCRPPRLQTVLDCPNVGTWAGGGVFVRRNRLDANTCWHAEESLAGGRKAPGLRIRRVDSGGEDEPVLHRRLERDGWKRAGPNFGSEARLESLPHRYFIANVGDDGWRWKGSRKHPTLRMRYRGYLERGRTFEFDLEGFGGLLDTRVEWATWSAEGDLLVARRGRVQRYTLDDLKNGEPGFDEDLEPLKPPSRASVK